MEKKGPCVALFSMPGAAGFWQAVGYSSCIGLRLDSFPADSRARLLAKILKKRGLRRAEVRGPFSFRVFLVEGVRPAAREPEDILGRQLSLISVRSWPSSSAMSSAPMMRRPRRP